MLVRVNRITSFSPDQLPKLIASLLDIEQALDKRLDALNIADAAITGGLIATGAVTSDKISGTPQSTSGQMTGDGTANRVISLGFTPRYVEVWRQADGTVFSAISDGTTALSNFWRVAAGGQSSGAADWQGIVTNGFKCGSSAASLSNKNAETYFYYATR